MQDSPNPDLPRSNRKVGLIGGVVGSIGLAASLFALTATAGASGPVLQATENAPAATAAVTDDDEGLAEDDAWAEFDACIEAVFESQGIDLDDEFSDEDFGVAVSIMDGDDVSFAEFGEADGSITITKAGDDISVTSTGDVMVEEFDWKDVELLDGVEFEMLEDFDDELFAELDEALSGCDDQLPEGFDFDMEFDELSDVDDDEEELTEAS